ncbi:TPA: hypothetical protein H7D72_002095 [Escherichia coli]|uniref:ATP-dependent Clp protease proteolytic subunit n=1 Tax=Escherichia coli TaxID=562 RepID=UPI001115EB09|nr:ATP-dependent Clp protease proteolytic subunit [Escherichia coli]HAL7796493.1 hypothetical protein [Escherichia coli]
MPQRNDRSRSTPTTSPKNNSWFRMQAGHQSDADIYIYDEIGFWGVTAKQFISDLNALGDITHINLHINSPGGDVFEGIAIFNALKTHGASNANGGIYQSADLSRYSGTVVNRPTFFAFAKGAGVMGEAGPEAILPLRRGADGKLGVVADIGGSGMAMFSPQYNIEINNDGTNGQIGPAALKAVYDLGKKAAADFMQQQARDGGRLSGAYR